MVPLCPLLLASAAAASAAMNSTSFTISTSTQQATPWAHHWEECVGSGHAALTVRADWRAHLSRCRTELGVKRTRFHGLLDDDFDISLGEGHDDYVNLDDMVDFHLSIGMEPLFEVSFTPSWLAINTSQTCTHYKGITSPPRDMGKWGAVVQRMAAHLRARYPTQAFMFEVWNEPNGGFWTPPSGNGSVPATDAEKQAAYFELYKSTADALKNASGGAYLVGGPATAGCPGWAAELVAFGEANNTAVDFISCHAYGGGGKEIWSGNVEGVVGNLPAAQRGAAGRPVVLTEWSSSWMYTNLYHDDPASAAFIIATAAAMDGLLNASSYWTFSDVFEEGTLLPVPFHGGFGLLTVGGTPKPSYRAFQLLHGTGTERYDSAPAKGASSSDCLGNVGVLATTLSSAANASDARTMRVFVWNHPPTFAESPSAPCNVTVEFGAGGGSFGDRDPANGTRDGASDGASDGATPIRTRMARVDVGHANPMAAWTAMGSPTYPSPSQLAELETASELVWENVEQAGTPSLTAVVPAHGLVIYDLAFLSHA